MKTQKILWFTGMLLCATITGIAQNTSPFWSLQGNSNATATSKLGTTNNIPLRLLTSNAVRLFINGSSGNIGIGLGNTANASYKLYVKGAAYGIYGTGTSYGIVGAGGSYGVYGSGTTAGLYGYSNGTYGTYSIGGTYGVYASGTSYGVYGNTTNGFGVAGVSTNSYGLYGSGYDGSVAYGSYIGAYGSGDTYGVYGYSSTNTGVYGYTGGGSNTSYYYGVYGYNASTGYGVRGYCELGSGVYGSSGSNYAGYFNGPVLASSYQTSDIKLKQNVKDFTSAMDIINKLRPKEFEYRRDGDYKFMNLPTGNQYGLIANEVEKVLPNLVRESSFDPNVEKQVKPVNPADKKAALTSNTKSEIINFKALNYTELIPIMIKGMQEQDAIIQKQQTQIDELKNMLTATKGNIASDAAAADLTGALLKQNSPNPFRDNTTVQFVLPASAKEAQLLVYDQGGQLVKSVSVNSKQTQVSFTKGSLPNGNYIYTLMVDGKKVDSKKMIIAK